MPERCSQCLGLMPSVSKRLDTLPENMIDEAFVEPELNAADERHREVSRRGHAHAERIQKAKPPKEIGKLASVARWGRRTPEQIAEAARQRRDRIAAKAPQGYCSVEDYRTAKGLTNSAVRTLIRHGQLAVIRARGHVWIPDPEVTS